MDTNLLSCSKCGHIVSDGAKTCAYCGAVVSSADSPPQPEAEAPSLTAHPVEPPPLPADDSPPALNMTGESSTTSAVSGVKSGAESPSPIQAEETRLIISESAAEAASAAQDLPSEVDGQFDFQLPDDELIMELGADEAAKDPEPPSGADSVSAGIKKPELNPDMPSDQDKIVDLERHAAGADAKVPPYAEKVSDRADADDPPGLPPTPVLEISGEDPAESETLGADILELVADEALEPEPTPDRPVEAAKSSGEPDLTADGPGIEDGELEAILLTSDDEVRPETPSLPADVAETALTAEPEKPVELVSATAGVAAKSAQGLAEAQKKQKAESDANLLMKQKAALLKAQALKKKKLILAQAQKRKKAAMVKARALEKQKVAQAGIGKANMETATGATVIHSRAANTKIMGLLKKYEGQAIGINYDNSADIKEAELVEVNDEFFSVFVKDPNLNYSHPLKTILTIIEGEDGISTGPPEQEAKFKAVIKVYPLVLF